MPYKDPEKKKLWRAKNRERIREQQLIVAKRSRAKHRETILEKKKEYYERNKQQILEYKKRKRIESNPLHGIYHQLKSGNTERILQAIDELCEINRRLSQNSSNNGDDT